MQQLMAAIATHTLAAKTTLASSLSEHHWYKKNTKTSKMAGDLLIGGRRSCQAQMHPQHTLLAQGANSTCLPVRVREWARLFRGRSHIAALTPGSTRVVFHHSSPSFCRIGGEVIFSSLSQSYLVVGK